MKVSWKLSVEAATESEARTAEQLKQEAMQLGMQSG